MEIACLGESSIVGISEMFRIIAFDGSRWADFGISQSASELWRGPDGRLVAWTTKPDVFDIAPAAKSTHWRLPETASHPRFASLDGLVAATSKRLYRLDDGGVIKDLGPTPPSLSPFTHFRGPVILRSEQGLIACFGTSVSEADDTRGHCVRHGPLGYHYEADFGDPGAALGDAATGTFPFACGDVVISALKRATQARRLADGSLVARTNTFARRGSACLPSGQALIVSKREVGVFDLPQLHRVWRRNLNATIKSAVVCGGKIAILLEKNPAPMMVDLPAGVTAHVGD